MSDAIYYSTLQATKARESDSAGHFSLEKATSSDRHPKVYVYALHISSILIGASPLLSFILVEDPSYGHYPPLFQYISITRGENEGVGERVQHWL